MDQNCLAHFGSNWWWQWWHCYYYYYQSDGIATTTTGIATTTTTTTTDSDGIAPQIAPSTPQLRAVGGKFYLHLI